MFILVRSIKDEEKKGDPNAKTNKNVKGLHHPQLKKSNTNEMSRDHED